ncbi:MAG: tetratricopeptide repeat protein, partial [Vicinamibacterales bacterium]
MRNFANLAAAALIVTVTPVEAWASARSTYESALAREEALRRAPAPASLADLRGATAAYQRVVRRYPSSAYCDNALWQAAGLARLAWERYGHEQDREAALTLLARLRREYSSSSLVPRIAEAVRALEPRPPDPPRRLQPAPPTEAALAPVVPGPGAAPSGVATLVQIQRSRLPDGVRITLHLDRE